MAQHIARACVRHARGAAVQVTGKIRHPDWFVQAVLHEATQQKGVSASDYTRGYLATPPDRTNTKAGLYAEALTLAIRDGDRRWCQAFVEAIPESGGKTVLLVFRGLSKPDDRKMLESNLRRYLEAELLIEAGRPTADMEAVNELTVYRVTVKEDAVRQEADMDQDLGGSDRQALKPGQSTKDQEREQAKAKGATKPKTVPESAWHTWAVYTAVEETARGSRNCTVVETPHGAWAVPATPAAILADLARGAEGYAAGSRDQDLYCQQYLTERATAEGEPWAGPSRVILRLPQAAQDGTPCLGAFRMEGRAILTESGDLLPTPRTWTQAVRALNSAFHGRRVRIPEDTPVSAGLHYAPLIHALNLHEAEPPAEAPPPEAQSVATGNNPAPPPPPEEKPPEDHMEDPEFYRQDLQTFYDSKIMLGATPEEAAKATKAKFGISNLVVCPTGEVRSPGVPDRKLPPPPPLPPVALPPMPPQEVPQATAAAPGPAGANAESVCGNYKGTLFFGAGHRPFVRLEETTLGLRTVPWSRLWRITEGEAKIEGRFLVLYDDDGEVVASVPLGDDDDAAFRELEQVAKQHGLLEATRSGLRRIGDERAWRVCVPTRDAVKVHWALLKQGLDVSLTPTDEGNVYMDFHTGPERGNLQAVERLLEQYGVTLMTAEAVNGSVTHAAGPSRADLRRRLREGTLEAEDPQAADAVLRGDCQARIHGGRVDLTDGQRTVTLTEGTSTVNRLWLRKQIEAGNLEAQSYSYDDQYGASRQEWAPAYLSPDLHEPHKQGMIRVWTHDLESRAGKAYHDREGTITLYVHSNHHITFRPKGGGSFDPSAGVAQRKEQVAASAPPTLANAKDRYGVYIGGVYVYRGGSRRYVVYVADYYGGAPGKTDGWATYGLHALTGGPRGSNPTGVSHKDFGTRILLAKDQALDCAGKEAAGIRSMILRQIAGRHSPTDKKDFHSWANLMKGEGTSLVRQAPHIGTEEWTQDDANALQARLLPPNGKPSTDPQLQGIGGSGRLAMPSTSAADTAAVVDCINDLVKELTSPMRDIPDRVKLQHAQVVTGLSHIVELLRAGRTTVADIIPQLVKVEKAGGFLAHAVTELRHKRPSLFSGHPAPDQEDVAPPDVPVKARPALAPVPTDEPDDTQVIRFPGIRTFDEPEGRDIEAYGSDHKRLPALQGWKLKALGPSTGTMGERKTPKHAYAILTKAGKDWRVNPMALHDPRVWIRDVAGASWHVITEGITEGPDATAPYDGDEDLLGEVLPQATLLGEAQGKVNLWVVLDQTMMGKREWRIDTTSTTTGRPTANLKSALHAAQVALRERLPTRGNVRTHAVAIVGVLNSGSRDPALARARAGKFVAGPFEDPDKIDVQAASFKVDPATLGEAWDSARTYYHVTRSDRLPAIAKQGLVPNKPKSLGTMAYDANRKDYIFLCGRRDLAWWWDRVEQWIVDELDDYAERGVTPVVLQVACSDTPEEDDMAKAEGRAASYKTKDTIAPDRLDLWSRNRWALLRSVMPVDVSGAFDDEGYIRDGSENPFYPPPAVLGEGEDLAEQLTLPGIPLEEGIDDRYLLKAVLLSGSPGAGKSYIARKAFAGLDVRVSSSDQAFEWKLAKAGHDLVIDPDSPGYAEKMRIRDRAKEITDARLKAWVNGMLPLLLDGTAKDYGKVTRTAEGLRAIGYDVSMVFVNTTLDVALARNAKRARRLSDDEVRRMYGEVQADIGRLRDYFGADNFHVVDNSETVDSPAAEQALDTKLSRIARQAFEAPLQSKTGQAVLAYMRKHGYTKLSDIPPDGRREESAGDAVEEARFIVRMRGGRVFPAEVEGEIGSDHGDLDPDDIESMTRNPRKVGESLDEAKKQKVHGYFPYDPGAGFGREPTDWEWSFDRNNNRLEVEGLEGDEHRTWKWTVKDWEVPPDVPAAVKDDVTRLLKDEARHASTRERGLAYNAGRHDVMRGTGMRHTRGGAWEAVQESIDLGEAAAERPTIAWPVARSMGADDHASATANLNRQEQATPGTLCGILSNTRESRVWCKAYGITRTETGGRIYIAALGPDLIIRRVVQRATAGKRGWNLEQKEATNNPETGHAGGYSCTILSKEFPTETIGALSKVEVKEALGEADKGADWWLVAMPPDTMKAAQEKHGAATDGRIHEHVRRAEGFATKEPGHYVVNGLYRAIPLTNALTSLATGAGLLSRGASEGATKEPAPARARRITFAEARALCGPAVTADDWKRAATLGEATQHKWATERTTYYLSDGPDASHYNLNVQIFDKERDARAAVAKVRPGNVWAITASTDTGYEKRGARFVAASDPATKEYAMRLVKASTPKVKGATEAVITITDMGDANFDQVEEIAKGLHGEVEVKDSGDTIEVRFPDNGMASHFLLWAKARHMTTKPPQWIVESTGEGLDEGALPPVLLQAAQDIATAVEWAEPNRDVRELSKIAHWLATGRTARSEGPGDMLQSHRRALYVLGAYAGHKADVIAAGTHIDAEVSAREYKGIVRDLDRLDAALRILPKALRDIVEPGWEDPKIARKREATANEGLDEGVQQTLTTTVPDSELTDYQLAERFKAQHVPIDQVYSRYVQARSLKPTMDAKPFMALYAGVSPNPHAEKRTVDYTPTHKSKDVEGVTMMVTSRVGGTVHYIVRYGEHGGLGTGGDSEARLATRWEPLAAKGTSPGGTAPASSPVETGGLPTEPKLSAWVRRWQLYAGALQDLERYWEKQGDTRKQFKVAKLTGRSYMDDFLQADLHVDLHTAHELSNHVQRTDARVIPTPWEEFKAYLAKVGAPLPVTEGLDEVHRTYSATEKIAAIRGEVMRAKPDPADMVKFDEVAERIRRGDANSVGALREIARKYLGEKLSRQAVKELYQTTAKIRKPVKEGQQDSAGLQPEG